MRTLLKHWTHSISNFIFQIFLCFRKTSTSHQKWFLHRHVNHWCPWTFPHSNFSLPQIPTDNSCCLLIYRRRPYFFDLALNAFYSLSVSVYCNFTNLPLLASFKSSAAVILLSLSCPPLSAFAGFLSIIFIKGDTCSAKSAASGQPKLYLTFTKPLAYIHIHIYIVYTIYISLFLMLCSLLCYCTVDFRLTFVLFKLRLYGHIIPLALILLYTHLVLCTLKCGRV